jgi:cytochrome oxidase assembly protein ShyY1
MTAPVAFSLGLLTMFVICCSLAAWYYARAKRRVKMIETHIANYQAATKTVGAALDQVYANPNTARSIPHQR